MILLLTAGGTLFLAMHMKAPICLLLTPTSCSLAPSCSPTSGAGQR